MPSGADLELARLQKRAGIAAENGQGYDAARLMQMEDIIEGPSYGTPAQVWVLGVDSEPPVEMINSNKWFIQLNFGDPVPAWVPIGSWILRK